MVVNFVLLSWLNAFYSFDYQWSLRGRRLEERIQFFERNWAYFLGRPPPSHRFVSFKHVGSWMTRQECDALTSETLSPRSLSTISS